MNELSNTPQRTSKRNAAVVDQDSMEKAAKLKAKKNLDTTIDKGNKDRFTSFNIFADSVLFNKTYEVEF